MKYEINGKIVESDNPLSDDEIDEIAQSFAKPSSPEPTQELGVLGHAQHLAEHLPLVSALAHPQQTVEDIGNYFKGFGKDPASPEFDIPTPDSIGKAIGRDLTAGAAPYAKQAVQQYEAGEYLPAAGRAAQTAMALSPLNAGQVSAGENFVAGKPGSNAEMLGELFNVGLTAAPKVLPALKNTEFAQNLSESLKDSAAKSFVKALNPRSNVAGKAARIAPEALERGVYGTENSMRLKAGEALPEAYDAATKGWENIPEEGLPADSLKNAYSNRINELQFGNDISNPGQAGEVAALQKQLEFVNSITDETGNVSKANARKLLTSWNDAVSQGGGWEKVNKRLNGLLAPEITDKAQAAKVGGDAYRRLLGETQPEIAAANKDISFWSNLQDVLDNRKGGSGNLPTQLGSVLGATTAGPIGGLKGYIAGKIVHGLMNSPFKGTMWAAAKNKIGKLLESGQVAPALSAWEQNAQNLRDAGLQVDDLLPPEVWKTLNDEVAKVSEPQLEMPQEPSQGLPDIYEGLPPQGFELPSEVPTGLPESLPGEHPFYNPEPGGVYDPFSDPGVRDLDNLVREQMLTRNQGDLFNPGAPPIQPELNNFLRSLNDESRVIPPRPVTMADVLADLNRRR